jgi:hypothetical protein
VPASPSAVLDADHDVEVVVRPQLFLAQRVDAPAAVDPDRHAGRLQCLEQAGHLRRRHLV